MSLPPHLDRDKPTRLTLVLSPAGTLSVQPGSEEDVLAGDVAWRIEKNFQQGQGLFHLGARERRAALPPVLAYWRDFSHHFMQAVSALQAMPAKGQPIQIPLSDEDIAHWLSAAPPMPGLDFLNADTIRILWAELEATLQRHLVRFPGSAARFFQRLHPSWHQIGRVHLQLAENAGDPERPFSFQATFSVVTRGLQQTISTQHPLRRALTDYAGPQHREKLASLMNPLHDAAKHSLFLQNLIDSAKIYDPQAWTPAEAYLFLQDVPALEKNGIAVRVPNWWKARPRPQVRVTVGERAATWLDADALLDFSVKVALGDNELTPAEWRQVKEANQGLALIKGQWVEIDRTRLQEVLSYWQAVEKSVAKKGLSFIEGMRLLAGADFAGTRDPVLEIKTAGWASVVPGKGLAEILRPLTDPQAAEKIHPGEALHATLRHYQELGVRWLWFISQLGLGACLADDMGLGKTIQVLALLLVIKQRGATSPHLIVVPASLLGNWLNEFERFAPSLRVRVVHPSAGTLHPDKKAPLTEVDVVLTTYGGIVRWAWLTEEAWHLVVLDEAQAIKNPGSQQTRAVKRLHSRRRLALTGTPVENRLSDLWSLFDFLSPRLLGSHAEFIRYLKKIAAEEPVDYGPLRALVRPYILRRLKTDKSVIADLPEKTELKAWCALTPKQAALYEQALKELSGQMEGKAGIQRHGAVLAFLLRLKQICNHPSQWLGDNQYHAEDSGKFFRLRELAETIAAKQEKVLVFTQFREMTRPLAAFLETVFGRAGLILDGATPVRERQGLVDAFQDPAGPPFFVLSLKAGGTGLNLTAASHVIHFDRWWNPAVENQATDRAYRIGQTKNVLVHKFTCRGTVEEKIDALIQSKVALAHGVIETSAEKLLTDMTNEELMELMRMDLKRAIQEP
jgi:superfamily II DNA or RNA helicase